MRRRVPFLVVALILLGVTAGDAVAVPAGHRNAAIVGEVRVCNIPDHCLTQTFKVTATDVGGNRVAKTRTSGVDNSYRLRVPAGSYSLLATSHGLRCTGSATAVAGETVTADIVCLVP